MTKWWNSWGRRIGTPLGLRATWRINGSGLNQMAVYFHNGELRKVRWLHLGRFVMEK